MKIQNFVIFSFQITINNYHHNIYNLKCNKTTSYFHFEKFLGMLFGPELLLLVFTWSDIFLGAVSEI